MTSEQWRQVKEIFNTAIELAPVERRAFIEEKSNNDELVIREVLALLASDEEAENFIEKPAVVVSDLVTDEKNQSVIGKQIGSYKIEKEIGRGGMGAVYLATRADEEFQKRVAIKLIKRGYDTDDIIRRFRHERQILAALDHPNITRLIDGGATEDGLPFLVMDYVEGLSLNQYCDERRLNIKERLKLFLQICSAVSYAHQNLIIHRDIKPSNILVTKEGTPKLLDFGIAKLLSPNTGLTVDKTLAATQAMTPEYASPEQILGQPVTTATDVYSLGVLLYELLTGHRPFKIKTNSPSEITRIIADSEPEKPSSIVTRGRKIGNWQSAIGNQLKGDLDNIVLMAMRKEAERRYSSVEQFATDIKRYLDGLPVIARQDTFGYRASKFIKRNKAAVTAGVGVALSLVAGIAATTRQARIAKRQSEIAKRQRDKARQEADKAEHINKFLQKMLSSADPHMGSKDVKVIEVLGEAAKSIESDFADQPEIVADLQTTIGLTYLNLGQIDLAEPHLRSALDARLKIFGRENSESAMSLYSYGQLLQAKGEAAEAENYYRQSLETLHHLFGDENLKVADVLHALGWTLSVLGRNDETIRVLHRELEIRRRLTGEDHPDAANAMSELGSILFTVGKKEAAELLVRRALAIMRRFHGDEHPDTARMLVNLFGSIQHKNTPEAEMLVTEALRIRRKILGNNHPDTAWALYHLSFLKLNQGAIVESEQLSRKILALRGTILMDENILVSNALIILGRSLTAQNRLAEAEKILRECLDLRRRTLPAEHWLLATTKNFLGECLAHAGQTKTGKILLLESYEDLKEKLGAEHDLTRQAFERLKKVH
jgi:serine/threonine-protein kinase